MLGGHFNTDDDLMSSYAALRAGGRRTRRFDDYFRCYPVVMMSGPERKEVNHGGKIIMPPSALEKLTRLHIAYPMQFELLNGAKGKTTHAGVLEFIAEEGRVYLPFWMMQTLSLEPGDLIQLKSTDLPSGSFIKLQPQSVAFLDRITDPKAVLENVLRNYSAMTVGDVFSFLYNDEVFEVAVLETKPAAAVSVVETDVEVDFAPPVDYVEPIRGPPSSGSSRPGSVVGGRTATPLSAEGSMSRHINYTAIAPGSAPTKTSAFSGAGQKLKSSKTSTPTNRPSTPAAQPPVTTVRRNGPQPLRLPHGKLFFGYEIKPMKSKDGADAGEKKPSMFSGAGQTLRGGGKKRKEGSSKGDAIEIE